MSKRDQVYGVTQFTLDNVQAKLEPFVLTEKGSAASAETLPKPDKISHGCRTGWTTTPEQACYVIIVLYDRGASPKLPIVLMRAMPVAAPGPCKKVAGQMATTARIQGLNSEDSSSCADKQQRPDSLTSGRTNFLRMQDRTVILRAHLHQVPRQLQQPSASRKQHAFCCACRRK